MKFSRVVTTDKNLDKDANRKAQSPPEMTKRAAIVSLDRLGQILAQHHVSALDNQTQEQPNYKHMFQHPSDGLRQALAVQSQCHITSQRKVQSLLERKEFQSWMAESDPGLILVDAGIREDSLKRLSAISLFCSTLVTTLLQVYQRGVVVVHFFCGLHVSHHDAWSGPCGLMRSLIVQVLMQLVEMDPRMSKWSLNFIDNRQDLKALEAHDLIALCQTLQELLRQFPPETRTYIIVDSISCFDTAVLREGLGTVINFLDFMVKDQTMVPALKVLLTNPGHSTRNITELPVFKKDPSRRIRLSGYGIPQAGEGMIRNLRVEKSLRRTPSPTPPPSLFRTASPARSVIAGSVSPYHRRGCGYNDSHDF